MSFDCQEQTKKTCVSVSCEDSVALESVLYSTCETQSFMMWVVTVLLKYFRECVSEGTDLAMIDRLCLALSGASVRQNIFIAKASAFLVSLRRSIHLSHMPPTINVDQKAWLLVSSPFSGCG